MDIKKAIKILKDIDNIPNIENMLILHNESYILLLNKLYQFDNKLASDYEELDIAAPYLFTENGSFIHKAKKACELNDIKIKYSNENDAPFIFYLVLNNYNFGITDR